MTPYKAAFLKKPDLWNMWEWGEKMWVRIEGGNKLGGCVREGRWLGLDKKLKDMCVYWPDTKNVSVEQNVYVNKTSASCFKGESSE
jgi:hypothetical protein